MQNAKDTFYEVLRGRLAALNPERTIVLRGVVRPAILVQENELVAAVHPPDCFRLEWSPGAIDTSAAMPAVVLPCVIEYETAGTAFNAGMDRGRLLSAMDGELLSALNQAPQNAVKMNYAGLARGLAAVTMGTRIWWGKLTLGKTVVKGDHLLRTATIDVMTFQEAGEL